MEIIQASLNDLQQVQKIISKLDTEYFKYSKEELVKQMIQKGQYYLLVDDRGEFKGAFALRLSKNTLTCELLTIVSNIKGGGRFIINWIEKKCKENGIPKLRCWSMAEYNAVGFYEKMGFTEKLLMKKQFANRDCWILGKVLD